MSPPPKRPPDRQEVPMNFDSQSHGPKNGSSSPRPRRLSALKRVAGTIPEGRDVGSSLDEFIATANQTGDEADGWGLSDDAAKPKEDEAAIAAREAARAAAEVARAAAEAETKRVLAEIS